MPTGPKVQIEASASPAPRETHHERDNVRAGAFPQPGTDDTTGTGPEAGRVAAEETFSPRAAADHQREARARDGQGIGAADGQVGPDTAAASTTGKEPGAARDGSAHGGAGNTLASWLMRHLRGHERAVVGGVCGLLLSLLVFAIGLFQTLFIVVLVVVGVAIGQFFDGDPRIIEIVRQFVSERRG